MFRKLINNSGTAMVSLDKRVLQVDDETVAEAVEAVREETATEHTDHT